MAKGAAPSGADLEPSQVATAYGINDTYFGATQGTGQGETIVLFDIYDDPDIASDLASFDSYYGIAAPPSFTKVEQSGVTVDTSGNWEEEESLDVEWAHALAPSANIVVYEANPDDTDSSLFAAVNTAATYGSVVSMSFTLATSNGVPEEISGETAYDSDFTSSGVTFLGATGDYGPPGGYPAYSPNVVAVGGTDLTVEPSYVETAWSGSGNGSSEYEAEPSYQSNGTISEYTTSGSTVSASLVAGLTDPSGIAVSGSDVFVTNSNGTIGEYTTSGATVNASLVSGLSNPLAIAVSGSDLFVTNSNGTIGEYTTSGATVNASLVTGLSTPSGITVSGSDLFVTNTGTGKIGEYTTSGTTVNASLVSGVNSPSGITVSGSDLFVTTGNGRIGEYTTSGSTVSSGLVRNLSSPAGITVSGNDLFVTNRSTGTVGEYTTSGSTVNAALITGRADPRGIAVSGGDLFVANDAKAIPDVSAVGGTPVGIYDSYTSGGPWFDVEGTSLSTPVWASIIAIADQGRVAAYGSSAALSGSTQTLPALYSAPSTDFRNANSSEGGDFTTGVGYQAVTGLGSPLTNLLAPDLVAYGEGTQLAVTTPPPSSVAEGAAFGLTVADEDSAGVVDTSFSGTVTIHLANNPGGSTLGGTLTATAVDGVATFSNLTLNEPGTGYTLQATASGLTSTTTSAFNVTGTAPVVNPSGNTSTYIVGGSPVTVDSGVTISTSANDADLTGASIAISAGTLQSGDSLNFTNTAQITGTYNATSGTLTLNGTTTVSQYQAALQSVTFSSGSENTTTRSLSIIADDGSLVSNAAPEQVDVTLNSLVVTPSGNTSTYTIGGSPVAVDSGVQISSQNSLTGASVTISAGTLQSGDSLNFTNTAQITGTYNAGNGTLTLNGNATVSQYQAALESVTFSTSSDSTTTRSLTIVADDQPITSNAAPEQVAIALNPPTVAKGGGTATYTVGQGSAIAIDNAITISSADIDITGATLQITDGQAGDTLNFTNTATINGSWNAGNNTLTLTGTTATSSYQTALQDVTFSTTSGTTTARTILVAGDDHTASPTASITPSTETVDIDLAPPSVTTSVTAAQYTAGASPVQVDGGITVTSPSSSGPTSSTGIVTSATMTISPGTLQAGDSLSFTNTAQITGSYNSGTGTLTLSGTTTAANYQAALQTVTFSNTTNGNPSAAVNRTISVVAADSDANDPGTASSAASDTVDVSAPLTVTGLYVKGTSWGTSFDNYLSSSGLGNTSTPSLGFALQTGSSQSKTLPWVNVNVIEATFNEQPGTINQNSLILSGGTGGSTPSVTGFSQLSSTTYAWTLSTSLTANRLEISFQATGGNAVTDANQAGLSGNWTGGTSAFPSGNGLAGTSSSSDFNFLFNSLPGDALRGGTVVNSTDYLDVRAKNNTTSSSTNYNPYYDVTGAGIINSTDYLDVRARNNNTLPANAPGPQDSGVGSLGSDDAADVGGAMLAVQEGSTSQIGATPATAGSNQTSGSSSVGSTASVASSGSNSSGGSGGSASSSLSSTSQAQATDEAVVGFDLADVWV